MAAVSGREDGRWSRACSCEPAASSEAPPGPVCYGTEIQLPAVADKQNLLPDVAREWDLLSEALGLDGNAGTGGTGTGVTKGPHVAVFPQLKWASVEKANTLMKVKALPAVKALTHLFSEAGFAPSVNFNVGSGELSLTVPLFAREGHAPVNAQQAVVCVMLAAFPEQVALEQAYADYRQRCGKPERGGDSSDLLANRCLDVFAKQTGVCIWQRTILAGSRTMKLSFAQCDDLSGAKARKMLRYSPCYSALAGFSDVASHSVLQQGSPQELQAALDAARQQLISDMEVCFWQSVAAFPYVATPSLRKALGVKLRGYLASGLGDPAGGFVPPPDTELSFFLLGGAGTGKSTMVAAFAQALQATLCRFMDTCRRVDIVKVPLNGLTPESLGMILRVQGISDMSIERLLEQSVQRGSTALLHLEEVPEDPALQEALVSTVKGMLTSLLRRYHHYAGNVILAFTSNYPPAPALDSRSAAITVVAPSAKEQWQHCVGMLETSLKGATQAAKVSVELKYTLPHMEDMRPLHQWWTTLSYHIARHVKDFAAAHGSDAPPRSVSASLSSANGGGMIVIGLDVDVDADEIERPQAQEASKPSNAILSGQEDGMRQRTCKGDALTSAPAGERGSEAPRPDEGADADDSREKSIWRGWGILARSSSRRSGGAARGSRTWLEAFMIDNDTQDPSTQGEALLLSSPLLPTKVEAPAQERCAETCQACARVGNIWTYVDCKGIGRDEYMPRPCSEPAIGVDGSEHVLSEELPAMHSRTNSFDSDSLGVLAHDALPEDYSAAKPVLTVSSMDGFFFVEGDGGDWGSGRTEAERFRRRKNATIVKMCLAGMFKPGVVVLTGADSARAAVESEILQQAYSAAGEEASKVVHVELREEADKDKVNGHQSQIRGGLFKTIDDFNNRNLVAAGGEGILAIVCRVNETGQYMLRELLETNGESRTHRFAIRKDRVLFVLSVDADAQVQEMTVSRSHALIDCSAAVKASR